MPTPPLLRPAEDRDIGAITAIYGEAVRDGRASFELTPPNETEMRARWHKIVGNGHPYLVATFDDQVVAFAYASFHRPRPAYNWTAEDSIYVDPRYQGQGVGSANLASVRLHARLGFRPVGTLLNVGYKHGRWLDTVLMQKTLGEGATTPPK